MDQKYIVKSGGKTQATFSKRSAAINYAGGFDNVTVIRETDFTTRTVFSRSVTKANGFVTISETQTVRAK